MIKVTVEIEEGPIELRMAFNDDLRGIGMSATDRVLELTAKAETAAIAALNATPRQPVSR